MLACHRWVHSGQEMAQKDRSSFLRGEPLGTLPAYAHRPSSFIDVDCASSSDRWTSRARCIALSTFLKSSAQRATINALRLLQASVSNSTHLSVT